MADTSNQVRVTDDSIQVHQLSHYQLSFRADDAGEKGVWTLQLVLDEGAWGGGPRPDPR